MTKEQLLRRFAQVNVLIGLYMILAVFMYQLNYRGELYFQVEVTPFFVYLSDFYGTIPVFNLPIVSFAVVFLLNLGFVVFVVRKTDTTKQSLVEAPYLNLVIAVLMIGAQIAFVYMIPEKIAGLVEDKILFTLFPYTSSEIYRAINLNYLFGIGYTLYNMVVVLRTMPPKQERVKKEPEEDEVLKEERLLQEFLKD